VRSHLPLVRSIARRYAGLGEEYDDLVQAGSVGLVRASARFDPGRGVAFATYVAPAVEGAIRRHLSDRRRDAPLPPAALGAGTDPAASVASDGAEDRMREPLSLVESEHRLLLDGGLRALDERERRIVFLRFNADMTERQIAQTVGISQAHVSRLLDGALTKLRAELKPEQSPSGAGITSSDAISRRKTPEIASTKARIAGVGVEKQSVGAQPGDATQQGNGRSGKTGYSGKFLVRMPSELHEQLSLAAEREEISLNRYVTDALSSSVGDGSPELADSSGGAPAAAEPAGDPRAIRRLRMALATNVAVVVVAGVVAVVLLVLALQRGI
jgi:RNA polymerase sigma-B factor